MKLGQYYIPDIKLSEAFDIMNRIYKEKINSEQGLATILGHSNSRSGTFQMKLQTLKNLGLVSSSVVGMKLTEKAEKIIAPKDPLEKEEGYKEVLNQIPLFSELKTRVGRGNVDIEKFWVHLFEITKIEKPKAQSESTRVRNIYNDAMQYDASSSDVPRITSSDGGNRMKYEPSIDIGTLQQDYIEIRTKDSVVKIPNDLHSIRKVKRILEMEEQELQEKETQTKKDKEL